MGQPIWSQCRANLSRSRLRSRNHDPDAYPRGHGLPKPYSEEIAVTRRLAFPYVVHDEVCHHSVTGSIGPLVDDPCLSSRKQYAIRPSKAHLFELARRWRSAASRRMTLLYRRMMSGR